jgi:cell division protein FtsW (lipid II flippase)
MDNIEKKMRENGFTQRELQIFRRSLEKKKSLTPLQLLHLLKKQFIFISIGMIAFALNCFLDLLNKVDGYAIFSVLLLIAFLCAIMFSASMSLTYKSWRFLQKNKSLD